MAETAKKRTYTKKMSTEKPKAAENPAPVEPEAAPEAAPAVFTEEQVKGIVAEAVAKALAQAKQEQSAPQIVQIAADVERVQFLYMAEVADDNHQEFGPGGMYGQITGKTGFISVPKSDLSRVMDSMFRLMMQRRWIIVVSGLTDEEREAYGVAYKDGEYLDERAFTRMIELGDKILEIYPKLCKGHREMVAKRYYEQYMSGNPAISRDVVVSLNAMSRKLDGGEGDFVRIIEAMNEADLKK